MIESLLLNNQHETFQSGNGPYFPPIPIYAKIDNCIVKLLFKKTIDVQREYAFMRVWYRRVGTFIMKIKVTRTAKICQMLPEEILWIFD